MKVFFLCLLCILCVLAVNSQADIPEKIQQSSSLLESGDLEGARKLLEEIISENPRHGPANLLLAQIDLQQFRWKEAEQHLQVATTSSTRRPHLAWHLLGRLYLLQHEYANAKESFDKALEQSPDFVPALTERARAELFLNQEAQAFADLQKVDSPEAKLMIAELQIHLGQISNAKTNLQAQSATSDAAAWLLEALSETRTAGLTAILGDNLGRAEAYFAMAVRNLRAGKGAQSDDLFRIAFQLDDQNPVPLLFLKGKEVMRPSIPHPVILSKIAEMKDLFDHGQTLEAERTANELVSGCPFCVPAYLTLIDIADQRNDLWQAVKHELKIRQWLPDDAVLMARMAETERKMGAFDAAECSARKALSMGPENGSLHYLFATILDGEKKTDAAIASCKRAIELGFQKAEVYVLLGNLYYQRMELSQSIAALQKAIELDPRAAENIASFALSALTTEEYATLRSVLEKHAEANPDNINTLYSLGVMYLNENKLDKAKDCFLKVQRLAPNHVQVNYNLALLYGREGNQAAAATVLSRFQELKADERKDWEKHNAAYRTKIDARDALANARYDQAISLYAALKNQGLAEEDDLLALAKAQQQKGDFRAAYATMESLLRTNPYKREAIEQAVAIGNHTGNQEMTQSYREKLQILSALSICK